MTHQEFFNQEHIIENDKIVIRPLAPTDIDAIEAISYTDELGEFSARVKTRTDLEDYFNFCITSKKNKELYPFLIYDKAQNLTVGITMFGNISLPNKRLEIGWTWIAKQFQGTGINQICKELLLNYCFNILQLRRIEFKIDYQNIKSQKAIEKLGAVKEGLLREYNIQSYGPSQGTYIYSILKNEWEPSTI